MTELSVGCALVKKMETWRTQLGLQLAVDKENILIKKSKWGRR